MSLFLPTARQILGGLALLALAPLVSATSDSPTELDATYAVTAAVLQDPTCNTMPALVQDGTPHPLGGLNLGVCLFHRFDRLEQNQQAIAALQQAQLVGLSANHQAIAQLLEGLLHCRQARHYRAAQLASTKPVDTVPLCMERRLGLTAVTNLDWDQALINYDQLATTRKADPSFIAQPDYPERLKELAACYDEAQNGPFNPNFATECREEAPSDANTVQQLAAIETQTLINAYLGSANPFVAMFSRKVDLIKGVQEISTPKLAELTAAVTSLRELYAQQAKLLQAYQQRIDPLIRRYQGSLVLGYQIMDNYKRWVKQFWSHPTEGDLQAPLKEECAKLASQTASLQEPAQLPQRQNCQGAVAATAPISAADIAVLEQIVDSIKGIETRAAEHKAAVKSMCQLYFCHLLARPMLAKTAHLCKRPLATNPLCTFEVASGKVLAVIPTGQATTTSVVNLCRNAGLGEEFLKVGLNREQKAACFVNH